MANGRYQIFETRRFLSDLQELDTSIRSQIQRKLTEYIYPQLKTEPYFGPNVKKLRDWVPETWRYRIGSWRIFYEIHESQRTVYLTTLDHRRDAYR